MWPMDLAMVDTETKLENVAVLETHVKKAKAIVTMITSAKKVWYVEVIIAVGISFGIQRIVVKRKVLFVYIQRLSKRIIQLGDPVMV